MSVRQPYPVSSAGGVAIGNAITDGTSGSVLFVDSSGNLAQDNPGITYDPTLDRLTLTRAATGILAVFQNTANASAIALGNGFSFSFLQFDADKAFAITRKSTITDQPDSGNASFWIGGDGKVQIGAGLSGPTATLDVFALSATTIGQIVRGAASQSASLLQLQNSNASVFVDSGDGLAVSEFVINQQGLDIDFRIEGDNDANLFRIDASDDAILLGQDASSKIAFYGVTAVVQQATIADADGTLADITTKFNSLLAKLETYGLLAAA